MEELASAEQDMRLSFARASTIEKAITCLARAFCVFFCFFCGLAG